MIEIPKNKDEIISSPLERTLLELMQGRKPVTPEEIQIAKEIQEIRDRGGIVEIPFDI